MDRNIPFYAKTALILLAIGIFVFMLYIGREIIVPLIYATIFAILLNPLVNKMQALKINRVIAILISITTAFLFTAALVYFITSQISRFSADFPDLQGKFDELLNEVIGWVSVTFNIGTKKITEWINTTKADALSNSGATMLGKTLLTLSGALILIFLLPVYIFMILFYKPLLLEFIRKLFDKSQHEKVAEVLVETKGLIQNYLIGLLIEAGIVATLNSVALLTLGIKYAILIAIIGALLNIIPYIGGIIAVSLPMIMALVTKSPSYALLVLGAYIVIQFIDNNFLVPKIVASKVKINALVSIVVVLLGNALWGVPGMFLSIPLTAIMKVIFDRIESLKPIGFLLGDTMPHPAKIVFNFKRVKRKS